MPSTVKEQQNCSGMFILAINIHGGRDGELENLETKTEYNVCGSTNSPLKLNVV